MNRIRIRPSRRPAEPKKPFLRDVRDNKQLYLLLLPMLFNKSESPVLIMPINGFTAHIITAMIPKPASG